MLFYLYRHRHVELILYTFSYSDFHAFQDLWHITVIIIYFWKENFFLACLNRERFAFKAETRADMDDILPRSLWRSVFVEPPDSSASL